MSTYSREIIMETFKASGIVARTIEIEDQSSSISAVKEEFGSFSSDDAEGYAGFALKYCSDERSGVQSLVKRSIKAVSKIVAERKRVHSLYENQRELSLGKLAMGMDEVGRGPLAGPLTIGAVVLSPSDSEIQGINDSKQVSASRREELSGVIRERALAYSIQHIQPAQIDADGMSKCLRRAFSQAIADIDEQLGNLGVKAEVVLLDGNPLRLDPREVNIVKGDATCAAISCASIIAKVERDGLMKRAAEEYPGYGWEHNAGYGSPDHIEKIKNCGLTPFHRKSFCKNFVKVD